MLREVRFERDSLFIHTISDPFFLKKYRTGFDLIQNSELDPTKTLLSRQIQISYLNTKKEVGKFVKMKEKLQQLQTKSKNTKKQTTL